MIELKLRRIGNSLGAVFPRKALEQLEVGEGDTVYLTDGPAQSLLVTAQDPEFEDGLDIAFEGMKKYRNTLRVLAE